MGIIKFLTQENWKEDLKKDWKDEWKKAWEEGLEMGRREVHEKVTQALLEEKKLSTSEIAKIMGVSTDFVNKIKKQLRLN